MKFYSRQNQLMLEKIRIVVAPVGIKAGAD